MHCRTFVTTLSKIQEDLLSNTTPRTNQSHDQLDRIKTASDDRRVVTLRKACSLDAEVPSATAAASQLLPPSEPSSDDDKIAVHQLVFQRAKQFESGSQVSRYSTAVHSP